MSSAEKSNLWKRRIEEYRVSNLTARDWCEQRQVSYSSLKYWITKFNKESVCQETQWVSLQESIKVTDTKPKSVITINHGDFSIDVQDEFKPETLISVLKVIGAYA